MDLTMIISKKNITFTVSVEKEVARIYKNGEEIPKMNMLYITIY